MKTVSDAFNQELNLGDKVAFVWSGGSLEKGTVIGFGNLKRLSPPVRVETIRGKRSWKEQDQIVKLNPPRQIA